MNKLQAVYDELRRRLSIQYPEILDVLQINLDERDVEVHYEISSIIYGIIGPVDVVMSSSVLRIDKPSIYNNNVAVETIVEEMIRRLYVSDIYTGTMGIKSKMALGTMVTGLLFGSAGAKLVCGLSAYLMKKNITYANCLLKNVRMRLYRRKEIPKILKALPVTIYPLILEDLYMD